MRPTSRLALLVAACIMVFSRGAAAASRDAQGAGLVPNALSRTYTVTDLGTLGGRLSTATAINDHGQVIGLSETAEIQELWRGFFWDRGTMIDLGSLGGVRTVPRAINNRGQVVGESETSDGSVHAFLWQDGLMIDLGALGTYSASYSTALAINNRGQVVGMSITNTGDTHAFLWEDGIMQDLDPLGPYSRAIAVNDRGQILGEASGGAFLWEEGFLSNLGTLGGAGTAPFDLNDRGQVVGYSFTANGETHAFLWDDGTMTDLGTLGGTPPYSVAVRINKHGQVVGVSNVDPPGAHAFMWERGTMTDLGPFEPVALNGQGRVVGNSVGAVLHAVLWSGGELAELPPLAGSYTMAKDMNEHVQIVGESETLAGPQHACLWQEANRPALMSARSNPGSERPGASHPGVAATSPSGAVPVVFEMNAVRGLRYETNVFDVHGRLVRRLGPNSGTRVTWDGARQDGSPSPTGVYFLRLQAEDGVHLAAKFMVVR